MISMYLQCVVAWSVCTCCMLLHDQYVLAVCLYVVAWSVCTCCMLLHDQYVLAVCCCMISMYLVYVVAWSVCTYCMLLHDQYVLSVCCCMIIMYLLQIIVGKTQHSTYNKINLEWTSLFHFLTCFSPSWRTILVEIPKCFNSYILKPADLCIALWSRTVNRVSRHAKQLHLYIVLCVCVYWLSLVVQNATHSSSNCVWYCVCSLLSVEHDYLINYQNKGCFNYKLQRKMKHVLYAPYISSSSVMVLKMVTAFPGP